MNLKNKEASDYKFLQEMYDDGYFPNFLVDKGKDILVRLCQKIEEEQPNSLEELYKLTHQSTEEFNELQEEFEENESEIETAARDCIGVDFSNLTTIYGFDADIEELIATRDW
ncbi:DUF5713 family protein [Microbulbifer sp. ANSA003]|uniref:DUF5713 family protein n=1 Tax=Microbulbifer sp. ANSA003 TaxID=3243360 RepID=UPI00404212B5